MANALGADLSHPCCPAIARRGDRLKALPELTNESSAVLFNLNDNLHKVLSEKSAKQLATERRQRIVNYLTDVLTSPDCPIERDEWAHFNYVGIVYSSRDLIDRFAGGFDEWPQMKEEILISIAVDALDRLL